RLADLPPDVLAAPVAHLDRSASLPVSAVQERLASALDHLVGSIDAGRRRSSRLRVALEDSRGRAERDQLAGLHNRHFLQRFLGPVDRPMDLLALLVDVDDLKSANDRHGHAAGDAVLRAIALVLRRSSRPGTSSCAGAATSSSCWSRASSRAPAWPSPSGWPLPCAPPARRAPGTNLPLSASIGVCAVSRSTLPLDRLDGALAVVKRGGKGRAALAPGGAALRPV
ncbi:MAG: hypothetical protein JWN08_1136, partial [Frankiales bacterium]|nr:hypothetical protein [Frankiales bacterium]